METRREYKFFTILQHVEEQEYLRKQHKAGWKFVKVTDIRTYHFEKCQPEDVVYQLDYNQEASKNKDEYIKMFEDCGWEYIQDFVGYSYFRKRAADMNGDEEIFNDDSSRLAMMMRVFRGRLLPLLGIFLAFMLPQFIMNITRGNYGLVVFQGSILMMYIAVFTAFWVYYYRLKNK